MKWYVNLNKKMTKQNTILEYYFEKQNNMQISPC